jgi:hypothetical protein
MGANVREPRTLRTPWPPTEDLLKTQPVTQSDNWQTLKAQFRRCDAWDIIYYNFATYNSEEVNWYLREWIGCHDLSPDGKNFRFGLLSNGHPMQIYIPTDDWLPPGPQQASTKTSAINILREASAWTLAFKAGPLELTRLDLLAVAAAIDIGKIRVIHRPCLGHIAYYDGRPNRNRLLLSFGSAPDLGLRALMVHEAVHAAMDIRRVPLNMQQSEGLAYIAQALYLRRNGYNMTNSVPSPPFAQAPINFIAWSGIFKFAASIAEDIDNGAPVDQLDLIGLSASITAAPLYWNQGPPSNDGI